jgi:hypothetical protein
VQTTAATADIEALIAILGRWNSTQLRVVLSAAGAASWHDAWSERLTLLPTGLELRVRRSRACKQVQEREAIDRQQLTLFAAKE